MKDNQDVIRLLNSLLTGEFTAINQYLLHAEMCQVWGYKKLHNIIKQQELDEIIHASWLIQRITFLGGVPDVSNINPIKLGKLVSEMVLHVKENELNDINAYKKAIIFAGNAGDYSSVDLLNKILIMKKGHLDWAETQRVQIERLGLENYLTNQKEIASCWF